MTYKVIMEKNNRPDFIENCNTLKEAIQKVESWAEHFCNQIEYGGENTILVQHTIADILIGRLEDKDVKDIPSCSELEKLIFLVEQTNKEIDAKEDWEELVADDIIIDYAKELLANPNLKIYVDRDYNEFYRTGQNYCDQDTTSIHIQKDNVKLSYKRCL
jgi:hypothetical protein